MVKKVSGPALKLDVPPLKTCDNCDGNGEIQGVFFEVVCDPCDGMGVLNKETGEQVPANIVVIGLRRDIRKLKHLIKLQQQKINDQHDPHAPVTTRHSGKVRLD